MSMLTLEIRFRLPVFPLAVRLPLLSQEWHREDMNRRRHPTTNAALGIPWILLAAVLLLLAAAACGHRMVEPVDDRAAGGAAVR